MKTTSTKQLIDKYRASLTEERPGFVLFVAETNHYARKQLADILYSMGPGVTNDINAHITGGCVIEGDTLVLPLGVGQQTIGLVFGKPGLRSIRIRPEMVILYQLGEVKLWLDEDRQWFDRDLSSVGNMKKPAIFYNTER